MINLPIEVWRLIYEFDPTFPLIWKIIQKELPISYLGLEPRYQRTIGYEYWELFPYPTGSMKLGWTCITNSATEEFNQLTHELSENRINDIQKFTRMDEIADRTIMYDMNTGDVVLYKPWNNLQDWKKFYNNPEKQLEIQRTSAVNTLSLS